jgi:hypothetical protein
VLDKSIKDKVSKLVEKSLIAKEAKIELDKSELDQLEILKA